ncbi:FtsX-like permease family protein [Jeotgalibacillus campisalis]|uniref:Cell division protein FtsX n=1 Tax=Jeotgalibacillus campisalis TaxID=220754 RepID=A0A0C2S316_9BACL|nr:FtsX-like permease family protein [Jeotgalibacillus campisalis]KIL48394.1 cell division protein FtsX [Jeotgalibacillus campisalis]
MNIINKLTLRHLKENKRRTLVTIVGVIISVAMIAAVATLGVSFLDLMKRQSIADNGEWHVQYKNVTAEQLEAIEEEENNKNVILSNDLGYAEFEEAENENKPYLFFKGYNPAGVEVFPVEVKDGRLPEAADEIVVPEHLLKDTSVDYGIGDELTVEIGERVLEEGSMLLDQNDTFQDERLQIKTTKTFKVVGMIKRPEWEPSWSPGYTMVSYIDQEEIAATDSVSALVTLEKVSKSLYKESQNLAEQNGIKRFGYNDELLRYYGVTDNDNLQTTLFSLAGIIIAVIIIGSVSLIYNAFAISVSERARHLGMLSSVGATKKQKRNSVFFEGAVIGLISIPVGILAGIGGIAVTFLFINSFMEQALGTTEKLAIVVTPASIIVACLISSGTIFISTYIPARKASKISAMDAIRQTQDIKLTAKGVKTSSIVRKTFGLEAEIGMKNMKRNKKRYYATVFSLVISIILFLSVSFFTNNLSRSVEMSQESINFDILVEGSNGDISEFEPWVQLEGVTEYSIQKNISLTSLIEEEKFPEGLPAFINQQQVELQDGRYPYYVNFYGLSESSFKKYADKVRTDSDGYQNVEQPRAILIEDIAFQDFQSSKFIETKSINANPEDTIELLFTNYETEEISSLGNVEIGALTDEIPMGISDTAHLGGLDVIVTMETLDHLLTGQEESEINSSLYLNSSDPVLTQEALEEIVPSSTYIYNVVQSRERDEQMIMFLSVFTYGFISLISLISIANIFNTISTSISLRKKEFAMLKSVGMTPKGFNKMIHYESIFYGLNSLLIGLPISFILMYLIHLSVRETFEYGFELPWLDILFVVAAIFIIVSSAMLYSISKIKKQNIIDGLKQENI